MKKLKIRAANSSQVLLKVIKNPVVNHLPFECLKIGTSTQARMVKLKKFASGLNPRKPIAFVVGAVSKGNPCLECDYIDDSICISKFSLSAACCLSKIMNTFEDLWEVE